MVCVCVSQTALHWAAKHGKEDMVTVMADAGADVNTKAVSPLNRKYPIVQLFICEF